MHRDYGPKGVKFFFIYKTLAHPELTGGYVQPFTLSERLAHARQADRQLGATIPWLVDPMDNSLKHALGDRANSEFVIDPTGKVVRKRAWSDPAQLRRDLEKLVGPVARPTREADIKLNLQPPLPAPADRGVVPRLQRPRMQPIVMEPRIDPKGKPFFAKLRPEGDADLVRLGRGKLYLGFHLDPFHAAHWNNLTPPLKFKLDLPEGVQVTQTTGQAERVPFAADADPREFLVDVEAWPDDQPIWLTVTYAACIEDGCHAVKQEYVLYRRPDRDSGVARGSGAGFWDPVEFARLMLARDRDGDRLLNRDEVAGLVRPHFQQFDINRDDRLDAAELREVARWLNEHHAPGAAPKAKR